MKRASAENRKPRVRITAYRVQLLRDRSVSLPRGQYDRPEDAVSLFRAYVGFPDREHLVAIWLDARRHISGIHTMTVGALAHVDASPQEVYVLRRHGRGGADEAHAHGRRAPRLHRPRIPMGPLSSLEHTRATDTAA